MVDGQIQDSGVQIPDFGVQVPDSRFQISVSRIPALGCHFVDVRSRIVPEGLLGGEWPWLYPIIALRASHDVLYTPRPVLTPVNAGILIEAPFGPVFKALLSPTTLFTPGSCSHRTGVAPAVVERGVPRVVYTGWCSQGTQGGVHRVA